MKRIKIKFLKTSNAVICAILSIMGFTTSCIFYAAYGTPSADYIIKGKVTDKNTNQPIGNIKVAINPNYPVYTTENGLYSLETESFPQDITFEVSFRDVDGELNGSYQDLDTIVEFKDPVFKGGDKKWYSGKATQEFDVQLTPEE